MTRSILTEEKLVKNLSLLGFEVFCSTSALNELFTKKDSKWLEFFELVIISGTISNDEVDFLLPVLASKKLSVYRIVNDEPKKTGLMNGKIWG